MTSSQTTKKSKSIAELASRGWVSLSQFTILADISYPTALKLVNTGKLESVRVGGVIRVYQEEVHRFLKHGNKKEGEGASLPPLSTPTTDE